MPFPIRATVTAVAAPDASEEQQVVLAVLAVINWCRITDAERAETVTDVPPLRRCPRYNLPDRFPRKVSEVRSTVDSRFSTRLFRPSS